MAPDPNPPLGALVELFRALIAIPKKRGGPERYGLGRHGIAR
jgi:hypothetical protein